MFKLMHILNMIIFLLWLEGSGPPLSEELSDRATYKRKWYLVDPPFG